MRRTYRPSFGEKLFGIQKEALGSALMYVRSDGILTDHLTTAKGLCVHLRLPVDGITDDLAGGKELVKRLEGYCANRYFREIELRGYA